MKKFLIIITLCLSYVISFSQPTSELYAKELAKQFSLNCESIIKNIDSDANADECEIQIQLPSYYDSELTILYTNNIMASYVDVIIYEPWYSINANISSTAYITHDNYLIYIGYINSANILYIRVNKI